MALYRASGPQVSGHRFYKRRTNAGLITGSAGLEEDPDRNQKIATAVSVALGITGLVIMGIASVVKPVGSVGNSKIVRDLDSGAMFVRVDDSEARSRLYPVLNLTSARLIAGSPANPDPVKSSALAKYPGGPLVGIPGAPNWPLTSPRVDHSRWAVCDSTADDPGAEPTVTALAGTLSPDGRAHVLGEGQAVLTRYGDTTYALWGSFRSPIDVTDRATALAVGVDSATTPARAISRSLLDAIPATPPLKVPPVPGAGSPSPWAIAPGVVVGSVLQVEYPSGGQQFYVLTEQGAQHVSPLVASLVRGANAFGAVVPVKVASDRIAEVPAAHVLDVDYYPKNRLSFVDPATNGVTCLTWDKAVGEKRSTTTILVGRTLPLTEEQSRFLVSLVRDERVHNDTGKLVTAHRVWVGPDAAALFRVTGMDPLAASRESIWWLAPNGVIFGVPFDQKTWDSLGLDVSAARQAPWPLVQVYARGPLLSRANAMVQQDTVAPGEAPAPLLAETAAAAAAANK